MIKRRQTRRDRRARGCRLVLLTGAVLGLLASGSAAAWAGESAAAAKLVEAAVDAYNEGDYEKSAAILDDAARQFPDHDRVFYWLGMARRKQGKWDEAYEAFKRECELDPKDAKACARLAAVCERRGDRAEAVRWYERAVALAPDDKGLQDKLAKARETKPATETPAAPAKKPVTSQPAPAAARQEPKGNFLRYGAVHGVKPEQRVWGHVAAAVLVFLAIPYVVRRICVKVYRLPLSLGESQATGWIVFLVTVVGCVAGWGYAPHWRMALLGVGSVAAGVFAFAAAKAESMVAIRTVLDWMARRR